MAAWSPDEDAVIRAHARTHSATQIAKLLPGRSRAAVVGRAWRLGASLAKDEATRRELENPGRRPGPGAARPPLLQASPPEAWPTASAEARRAALAVEPRLLPLEALSAHACRWPYGETELRFCGRRREGGRPYCAAHAGLAFVPDPSAYDPEAVARAIERREQRGRPNAEAA